MPKPNEYLHIKAWGRMLGSDAYYIEAEQFRAAAANAPLTAIFERTAPGGVKTGEWATSDGLPDDHRFWPYAKSLEK